MIQSKSTNCYRNTELQAINSDLKNKKVVEFELDFKKNGLGIDKGKWRKGH